MFSLMSFCVPYGAALFKAPARVHDEGRPVLNHEPAWTSFRTFCCLEGAGENPVVAKASNPPPDQGTLQGGPTRTEMVART